MDRVGVPNAAILLPGPSLPHIVNRKRTRPLKRKDDERSEVQEVEFIPDRTELRARGGNARKALMLKSNTQKTQEIEASKKQSSN